MYWACIRIYISFICNEGVLLLSFYSLGLAIPFILSGYYMSKFLTTRKGFSKYYGRVTKTGLVILLLTGVLIATNQIHDL